MRRLGLVLIPLALFVASASADLVGWWPLDEGSGGVITDASDYGNNGTIEPWNAGAVDWDAKGHAGGALSFTTVYAGYTFVEAPMPEGLLNIENATIGFWSKTPTAHQNWGIIVDLVGVENDYSLEAADTGIVYLYSPWFGGGISINDNQWHHLVLTTNSAAGTATIYIDGAEVASTSFSVSEAITAVRIGGPREYVQVWATYTGLLDDVVVYNEALDADAVFQLYRKGPAVAPKARSPKPANGYDDVVAQDVQLSWRADLMNPVFDVYVGTSYADVDQASRNNAMDVLLSQAQDANALDYGRIDFSKTYYWRVDEVNTVTNTIHRGDIWSFTGEPYSLQIPFEDLGVTASSSNIAADANQIVNGAGLDPNGLHSTLASDMWQTSMGDSNPGLTFEFNQVKKLDTMRVWNYNETADSSVGWSVKDMILETSVDGTTWSLVEGADQLSRGPAASGYAAGDVIDLEGITARFVKMTFVSNWGGLLTQYGLSEIQFKAIPAYARELEPGDGALNVDPRTQATWRAGRGAVEHVVTVDAGESAVAAGTASSRVVQENSVPLADLDVLLGTTYYWRVDEVNDATGSPWLGNVQSFSTSRSLVVDDFESYTNVSPDRPFQTWLDGIGYSEDVFFPVAYNGNGTGAGVGHDIWALDSPHFDGLIMETDTVKGGDQSLPLYYNNSGGGTTSHTDRMWSTPQDWTGHGIQTLVVNLYGDPSNTGGPVFVEINGKKVTPPDNANLQVASWHQWDIDLASLGANLSAITSMSIGVEGTGSGMILLDDIALYRIAPQPVEGTVFDFETDTQGWAGHKDGTLPTISNKTHSAGGLQSLMVTIDEGAHTQQEGGFMSPSSFTAQEASDGLKSMSFWYRVDDPDLDGGNFVFHWESSNESGSGGGWYGNNLQGVVIADGLWHQQTLDLSILGEAAGVGGWQGAWGDMSAWEFRDDLFYAFSIAVQFTDNTSGSNVYIDDIVFSD